MKIEKIIRIDSFGGKESDLPIVDGCIIRIWYSNGTVREKIFRKEVTPEPEEFIYLHVEQSKDNLSNDGQDSLIVRMTFRKTEDPESDVLTAITNKTQIVTIRDTQNIEYDVIKVGVTDGVIQFTYTSTYRGATVKIPASDLEKKIGGKQIKLVGEVGFVIYRDFTEEPA